MEEAGSQQANLGRGSLVWDRGDGQMGAAPTSAPPTTASFTSVARPTTESLALPAISLREVGRGEGGAGVGKEGMRGMDGWMDKWMGRKRERISLEEQTAST
jgi:hypothetical protein